MCLAKNFESFIPRAKAISPERMTVVRRVRRCTVVSWGISSDSFAAIPERVFPIIYRVMNESERTSVFIAPRRKRNPRFDWGKSSEPRAAACPEPMPGRKEQSGAQSDAASVDFAYSFLESFIFLCEGRF